MEISRISQSENIESQEPVSLNTLCMQISRDKINSIKKSTLNKIFNEKRQQLLNKESQVKKVLSINDDLKDHFMFEELDSKIFDKNNIDSGTIMQFLKVIVAKFHVLPVEQIKIIYFNFCAHGMFDLLIETVIKQESDSVRNLIMEFLIQIYTIDKEEIDYKISINLIEMCINLFERRNDALMENVD